MEAAEITVGHSQHVTSMGMASNGRIDAVSSVTFANSIWWTAADTDWVEFSRLVARWKEETRYMSSVEDMARVQPFRDIVALGPSRAIPMIVRKLQTELGAGMPYHWWRALEELAQQNPVPPALMGDLVEASRFWVEWARARYGMHKGSKIFP